MLDDLAGLRRDPVGELHLELHQQVAALGRALGQGQAFAPQAPDGARLDDVAARHWHHPAVEGGDVHGAAAQSLGREGGRSRETLLCRPGIFRSCFISVSNWPEWREIDSD